MSPLPTFDKATVNALRKGDESALERVLRDGYASLVEDATKQLGDAAAAPRVVERAIAQVWDERGWLELPEELDKALKDAVRGNAISAARKRAAGDAAESGGPTTVDQVWTNVVATIRAPKAGATHTGKHTSNKAAHAAASHMATVGKRSLKVPIITGIAVLGITGGILWFVNRKGEESNVNQSLLSPEAKHLASSPGQRASMTLSDDSKVDLGSDSQVIVPPTFDEKYRVVRLLGTATFTIKPNELKPFEVRAGDAVIVGKGSTFSVRSFSDEDHVTLKVKEGDVAVSVGTTTPRTVAAGASLAIAKDGSMAEPNAEALNEAFSWIDGSVIINNRSLKDALNELRRWYGLDLVIKDSTVLTRMVSMTVPLSSKMDAIKELEKAGHVKFAYEKQTAVLLDAPGGAAAKPAAKPAAKAAAKKAK